MSGVDKNNNKKIIDKCLKELQKDKKIFDPNSEKDIENLLRLVISKKGDINFFKNAKNKAFKNVYDKIKKEQNKEKEAKEQETNREVSKSNQKVFTPLQEEDDEEKDNPKSYEQNKEKIEAEIKAFMDLLEQALYDYQQEESSLMKKDKSENKDYEDNNKNLTNSAQNNEQKEKEKEVKVNNYKQFKGAINGAKYVALLNDLKLKKQQEFEKDPYVMSYSVPFESIYYLDEISGRKLKFKYHVTTKKRDSNFKSNRRNCNASCLDEIEIVVLPCRKMIMPRNGCCEKQCCGLDKQQHTKQFGFHIIVF